MRRATVLDVPSIARIYNESVRTTTASFDVRPRTLVDRRRWFAEHGRRHPVFVAVRRDRVVGWASLSPWSDRRGYDATAEVSTYVRSTARGQGVGSALLAALIREGRSVGFHTLIARIADGNAVSLRLHGTAGFTPVGVMREVGLKFGRRLDVHLLQLLYPSPNPPASARNRSARPPASDEIK